MDATLGSDVVLKTLLTNPEYAFMIWSFSDGTDQVNIATQGQTALKVNSRYESRVSVNATDGYLTLRKLTREDNGDYSLTVVSADGTTSTGEIKLRVLGESEPHLLPPAPAQVCSRPASKSNCTDQKPFI